MKKRFLTLGLASVLFTASLPLTACEFLPNDGKDEVEQNPFVQTLNDFETLDDLYINDYDNGASRLYFGKINLNKDAKYITSGNASACFDVHGNYTEGGLPTVAQFKFVTDENYLDFSRLKAITFDFFNETGEEQLLGLALGFDKKSSNYQYVTVKAGYNQVRFSPDLLGVSIAGDLTRGESLYVDFAKPKTVIGEARYNRYYMDNIQMEYALKSVEPLEITLDEDTENGIYEIAYFEKYYQQYIVQTHCIGPGYSSLPTLTVNSDPKYCKNNTGKSLKAAFPIGSEPMNDGWPGFAFNSALWDEINLTQMAADDMELVFDVYNASADYRIGFYVNPLDTKKSVGCSYGFDLKSEQWTEVRISVAEWNKFMEDEGEDTLKVNLTDNVGLIFILINKPYEALNFYFDNFRFEPKKSA